MKEPNILSIFMNSLRDFYKNPLIIVPVFILLAFFTGFSKLSVYIQHYLKTTPLLILWLVLFSLIAFLVMSYFFTALIGFSKEAVKGQAHLSHLWKYANKFWIKNIPIMALITIVSFIVFQIAVYLAYFIGKALHLLTNPAAALFFLILFAGLISIIIFFTFSSFNLIIYNLRILESIKKSFIIVKANYFSVLSISVLFFILYSLLEILTSVQPILAGIIKYLLVTPYLSLVLTRFLLLHHNDILS